MHNQAHGSAGGSPEATHSEEGSDEFDPSSLFPRRQPEAANQDGAHPQMEADFEREPEHEAETALPVSAHELEQDREPAPEPSRHQAFEPAPERAVEPQHEASRHEPAPALTQSRPELEPAPRAFHEQPAEPSRSYEPTPQAVQQEEDPEPPHADEPEPPREHRETPAAPSHGEEAPRHETET
jgi:hypothetical protein